MRRARGRTIIATLVAAAAAGCGGDADAPVRVDGVTYEESEVRGLSADSRETLSNLTAFGVAVARDEVERVGRPFIEQNERGRILGKLAAMVTLRSAGIDEDSVRALYRADPRHELVVRHLVVLAERPRSEEEAREARSRADRALERIRSGERFADVAADVSDEPGAAERGGLLEPGRRDSWVPGFWEAASALEEGEVSGIVETRYGYHVIRLEERRIVPFEEVRGEVVSRLAGEERARVATGEWARRRYRRMTLRRDAIARWRRGELGDTAVLATWPGGEYAADEIRDFLLTVGPETKSRLEAASDSIFVEVVESHAGNAMLAAEAREMGLRLSPEEREEVRREWRKQAARWARSLGFRSGMDDAAVKAAAREALSSTAQGARIARSELREMGPALRAAYAVRVASPRESGGEEGE